MPVTGSGVKPGLPLDDEARWLRRAPSPERNNPKGHWLVTGSGAGPGGSRGIPSPVLFLTASKRERAAAGGRENRFDERAARLGRSFVMTGVGRIGPAGIDGPVVPAPDRSREELRSRITPLGGGTGWKPEMACFYSRAFRFTRKGYASSVRQQSCQRLRNRYALPGRLR